MLFVILMTEEKWLSIILLKDISVENVTLMYELAEAFNAMTLREACILFILEQFERLSTKPWYVIPSLPFYNKRTNCVLLSKNLSGYKLFPLSWFESCRYSRLIQRMVPDIRNYFIKALAKPVQIDATQL